MKSAQRVFQILEFFEQEQHPATLSEIALHLGYPVSSTSMLVRSMISLGYLGLDPASRKISPTLRVGLLGNWVQTGNLRSRDITDLVSKAKEVTGLTATVATLDDMDAQYIHVIRAIARDYRSLKPACGTRRPVSRCAVGVLLLSRLADRTIELYIRKLGALRRDVNDFDDLRLSIALCRQRGYAAVAGKLVHDLGDVAVHLPCQDAFAKPMALSVGASANKIMLDHEQIADRLQDVVHSFGAGFMPSRALSSVPAALH